jgi:uncharacterized protein (TIGR02452 family)
MNREQRKKIAEETLQIQERGSYNVSGVTVDFSAEQKQAVSGSRLITPETALSLLDLLKPADATFANCKVITESVVKVIGTLCAEGKTPAVLNFASAKNPGGGFLNGSIAQEEALAISSGLYRTLTKLPQFYDANKKSTSAFYTHHAIYSPSVGRRT